MTLSEYTLMESIAKLKEQNALLEKSELALEELVVLAIGQRDEYKRQLQELLAVIHRDGGHHTEARGIGLSCLDAREEVQRRHEPVACSECFRLRALLRGAGL
jgi:phage-related protein